MIKIILSSFLVTLLFTPFGVYFHKGNNLTSFSLQLIFGLILISFFALFFNFFFSLNQLLNSIFLLFSLIIIFKYRKIEVVLSWKVTFISAFIGSYSHVALDSIMHSDINPFYPLEISNNLLYLLSHQQLHIFCLISGIVGFVLYEVIKKKYKS